MLFVSPGMNLSTGVTGPVFNVAMLSASCYKLNIVAIFHTYLPLPILLLPLSPQTFTPSFLTSGQSVR